MEEQYAAIGKAHAALKEKKERLRALLLTVHDLGQQFERLGRELQQSPEAVGLNSESQFPISIVPPGRSTVFDRKLFDADKFRDLTHEIRETMQEIHNLEQKLA